MGVAAQVELGREPAPRAAQRLALLPPFAPAACWWARIVVPSSICNRSSAAPLPAKAANRASNTPRSRHRAKRRQTVFHLPYRSGMVRQRAPSRARHRIPSRCRRFSCPGRPRPADSNGPTSSHSAFVRSPEATPSSHRLKGGRTLNPSPGALRPHGLGAAPTTALPAAATPAASAELLRAAGAGLATAPEVLLVGLDAADRPAGHLDLLGHAAALATPGRPVEAYTLADLDRAILDEAPATTALVVSTTGDFGIGDAASQLCFEELLRRSGGRPVRLALRRLAPSSLELGGRLVEAVRRHPAFEVWVSDAVSRSYAALLFGAARVRLAPPGIAGVATVLGNLRKLYAEVVAELPRISGPTAPGPDGRLADLDAWHAGFDRDAGRRLGHLTARLAGTAHLLRTPALAEAWSLVLPGSAALAAGGGPLETASLDIALFAALSGRSVELTGHGPGAAAFATTWRSFLEAVDLRLATPPVRLAG